MLRARTLSLAWASRTGDVDTRRRPVLGEGLLSAWVRYPSAAALFILMCVLPASARVDPDSEYLAQIRREGHTELCRAVGKPSNRLAAAINSAMEQDPTWAAEAAWFQRIAEAYERAGCGDA